MKQLIYRLMLVTAWSWWQTFGTVTSNWMKKKYVITNFILNGCASGLTLQPRQTATGKCVKFLTLLFSRSRFNSKKGVNKKVQNDSIFGVKFTSY